MSEKQQSAKNVAKANSTKHHDFLHGIFWGVLLIYIGVLFLLVKSDQIYEDEWFTYFFFGLGILLVTDYFIRMFSVQLRSASCMKLVFGAI